MSEIYEFEITEAEDVKQLLTTVDIYSSQTQPKILTCGT